LLVLFPKRVTFYLASQITFSTLLFRPVGLPGLLKHGLGSFGFWCSRFFLIGWRPIRDAVLPNEQSRPKWEDKEEAA
jgi:hypothetical protein